MNRSERSSYTSLDFIQWREAGSLVLSPKFQRRGVWTTPARSYLIDTLLLDMPVPPIYLRIVQSPERTKVVREVIDGQQRISAVLDFIGGKYALSKGVETQGVSGKKYRTLSEEQQLKISQYSFICEAFHGISDQEVLQIFSRLNVHSVKLNAQELRNGKYFGEFKRITYTVSLEYLEFWRRNKIFSEQRIARMAEVEMTSELLILQLAGPQDKKKTIDDFYDRYDTEFPDKKKLVERFRRTIDEIAGHSQDILSQSHFKRSALFYSLFGAVYHRLFGVPGIADIPSPAKRKLTEKDGQSLASAMRNLSAILDSSNQGEDIPRRYSSFVNASASQTDNLKPRVTRIKAIYEEAFTID